MWLAQHVVYTAANGRFQLLGAACGHCATPKSLGVHHRNVNKPKKHPPLRPCHEAALAAAAGPAGRAEAAGRW